MTQAFVVMTALPPTKGHLQLLLFSAELADEVTVLVCTQPEEPFPYERFVAIRQAMRRTGLNVKVRHFHETIEQNPEAPGFWAEWRDIMVHHGFRQGDLIVASEKYGRRFAEELNGKFMPFDIDRDIYPCKASLVRKRMDTFFHAILPEFQPFLRQTVTFIGAESTGKTTLSKFIAKAHKAHWLMEWARPYLEVMEVPEITYEAMNDIWQGQRALQRYGKGLRDKPWVIQDTDLFATVGYWDFWKGDTPVGLVADALKYRSDLYIVVPSNIPYEDDPIRYGNGVRESNDQFWIDLMEKYGLNYKVLTSSAWEDRVDETYDILAAHWQDKVTRPLTYERAFN